MSAPPSHRKGGPVLPRIDHVLAAAIVFGEEPAAYLRGKESVITAGFPSRLKILW